MADIMMRITDAVAEFVTDTVKWAGEVSITPAQMLGYFMMAVILITLIYAWVNESPLWTVEREDGSRTEYTLRGARHERS